MKELSINPCYPPVNRDELIFTKETVESLGELGEILKKIHKRLISEGYTIVDGKIKKLDIIKY